MDWLTDRREPPDPFDSAESLTADAERLDAEIANIISTRRFLSKALATLAGIMLASGSVHFAAKLGLPAVASGSLGGIVLGMFALHALTKIRVQDGRPRIDQDFFVAAAGAGGVGSALWLAFGEHRRIAAATRDGQQRFFAEVKAYEVKPEPPDRGLLTGVSFVLGILLLVIGIAKMLR